MITREGLTPVAYLFQLEQNGSVTEVGKVTASDADANDEFGRSVSLLETPSRLGRPCMIPMV